MVLTTHSPRQETAKAKLTRKKKGGKKQHDKWTQKTRGENEKQALDKCQPQIPENRDLTRDGHPRQLRVPDPEGNRTNITPMHSVYNKRTRSGALNQANENNNRGVEAPRSQRGKNLPKTYQRTSFTAQMRQKKTESKTQKKKTNEVTHERNVKHSTTQLTRTKE